MEPRPLIELIADIMAGHLTKHHVSVSALPGFIGGVRQAPAGPGAVPVEEPTQKSPAVSVRASIKPGHLVCLECGRKQKMIRRHLAISHNMSPEQYREVYGLARDYPMVAPNYSDRRSNMAKAIGLGRKIGPRRIVTPTEEAKPRSRRGGRKKTTK